MKTSTLHSVSDLESINRDSIQSNRGRVLPINLIKDLIFHFDINFNDVSKLIDYVDVMKDQRQFKKQHQKQFNTLTQKEKQIFFLVTDGYTSKEIASKLFVEQSTISTHRKHIKRKLELQSNKDWFEFATVFKNT